MKLILASHSPRRIEFLQKWGFDFQITNPNFLERTFPKPEETIIYNAYGKASTVALRRNNSIVIGMDTVVVLKNEIIGKPENNNELMRMLRKLSNETHTVMTGVAVVANKEFITDICKTRVNFRRMTEKEIKSYAETGEGMDKAGGYAIQGIASDFIIKVDGLIDNVIGMPVMLLKKMLNDIKR